MDTKSKHILITGGLGFIGSHICVELLTSGFIPIIVDNLSNSDITTLERINKITGITPLFYAVDVKSPELYNVFDSHNIDCVIHMAGLKSVNESINNPIDYYDNNINSTLNLIKCMEAHNCYNLIFSSSATVYGTESSPLTEDSKIGIGITNPYGETKFFIEKILMSLCKSNPIWNITSLRYFNPAGAHISGLIGENPKDIPNNLMPYIMRVAKKNDISLSQNSHNLGSEYRYLKIFGSDYNTPDGTCIRDFIHVVDLAKAHLATIHFNDSTQPKYDYFNIGTGKGVSVLEMVSTFANINGHRVPYLFTDRRHGDIDVVYCDNSKALSQLNWKPEKTIKDICKDAYNFQKMN